MREDLEPTEAIALWMIDHGYTTVHGDTIHDLLAELVAQARDAPAQSAPAWQPIETAPRDGSKILATGGGLGDSVETVSYNEQVGAWNSLNDTLDDCDDEPDGYSRPRYWMPTPTGPSLTSAERKD